MSSARLFLATTLLLLLTGCALLGFNGEQKPLDTPWSADSGDADPTKSASSVPVLKVAQLEANIVRRPANDSRMRTLVWQDLDESGPMSPEVRQQLNRSGFRVGVAGSSTPWALQSLAREASHVRMTVASDTSPEALNNSFQMPVGPAFSVFEKGVTRLEVQSSLDASVIPLESIAELHGLRDLSQLKCVIEVTIEELDQGWVLINVLPQIHSGSSTTRLSINSNNSQLPVRQNIYPLYEQQFQLKLHRGEVAVIGRYGSDTWNAGRLFFQPDTGSAASEALLLIRLVGVDQVKGRSDLSVSVGKNYAW